MEMSPGLALLFILLPLSGCLGSESSVPNDDPPAARHWTATPEFVLPRSGVYLVPYVANTTQEVSLAMWMDGGTWKGLKVWILPEGGGYQPWGQLYERREFASRVFEDRRAGEYVIDCLGERNGSFCEAYNNTVDPGLPLSKIENRTIFADAQALPAGRNYLLVQASFDRLFRLEIVADEPMWVGAPLLAGDEIRLAPEFFRGNHIDITRCLSILWCGHLVDAEMKLERDGWDSLLLAIDGRVGMAVPYLEVCLSRGSEDIQCKEEGLPQGTISRPMTLQRLQPYEPGLVLRSDVVGLPPPTDSTHRFGWFIGGSVIWFNMPTGHPYLNTVGT